MGNGADLLILMNLAEPAGFFDGGPPRDNFANI
jgi:hypothetical protein